MPLIHADFVEETTTTTGTGTLSLAGATTGNRTFVSGIGDGNTCTYAIRDANGTAWEVGVGTVTDAATDTLSRDTVIASSTGSKISLSTGTHTVYCTWSAEGGAKAYSAIQSTQTEYSLGNLGSSEEITIANGIKQRGTVDQACTISLATPSAACTIRLRLVNSGAGNTITWPASGFRWVTGTAPTFTTADAGENIIILDYGSTGWVADGGSL